MITKPTLDNYRLLGHSGLRVSPLCLGAMTFGTEWGWGADEAESRRIFDVYTERGGNFIDTANKYTNGTSEEFVSRFIKGQRDRFVLATKYTLNMRPGDPNAGGNHRKNMMQSVEASLKRLQTDYIDLYWLHAWDDRTPADEIMRGLDDLVSQGKVLYVGISDTPAWRIARMNTLAQLRGWTPFIALQIQYSLVERTVERELIPMARELGLGVLPWSPLAGGVLSGKYSKDDLAKSGPDTGSRREVVQSHDMLNERSLTIAEEVKRIAKTLGHMPSQIALHWLLRQPGVTSPILGTRKLSHLEDNLGALEISLSSEHLARLDKMSRIELGFPHDFLGNEFVKGMIDGGAKIEAATA